MKFSVFSRMRSPFLKSQEDLSQTGLHGMPRAVAVPTLTWKCLLTKAVFPFISWGCKQTFQFLISSLASSTKKKRQDIYFLCFHLLIQCTRWDPAPIHRGSQTVESDQLETWSFSCGVQKGERAGE